MFQYVSLPVIQVHQVIRVILRIRLQWVAYSGESLLNLSDLPYLAQFCDFSYLSSM